MTEEEVEPIRKLGQEIRTSRVESDMSLRDLAQKMDVSPVFMSEVERGVAVLDAEQIADVSAILGADHSRLLKHAQEWHREMWKQSNKGEGFQLSSIEGKTNSLSDSDMELEKRAAEVLYTSVATARGLQQMAQDLIVESKKLQDCLISRGVLIEQTPPIVSTEKQDPPPSDANSQ